MTTCEIIQDLCKTYGRKYVAYHGGVSYNTVARYCRIDDFMTVKFLRNLKEAGLIKMNVELAQR